MSEPPQQILSLRRSSSCMNSLTLRLSPATHKKEVHFGCLYLESVLLIMIQTSWPGDCWNIEGTINQELCLLNSFFPTVDQSNVLKRTRLRSISCSSRADVQNIKTYMMWLFCGYNKTYNKVWNWLKLLAWWTWNSIFDGFLHRLHCFHLFDIQSSRWGKPSERADILQGGPEPGSTSMLIPLRNPSWLS